MVDRAPPGYDADPRRGPLPSRTAWFPGTAASGAVEVAVDGPARAARVRLRDAGRDLLGPRLAAAVLAASAEAVSARGRAWAEAPTGRLGDAVPGPGSAAPPGDGGWAPTREVVDLLVDAVRDLGEFGLQLEGLQAAARTTTAADGRVRATVRAGQIVDLVVDHDWSARARRTELEHQLGAVLTAALLLIAQTPQQALARCPALASVLARVGGGPPAWASPNPSPTRHGGGR